MIGIINYGSGNIEAIANIYKALRIDYKIISLPAELEIADKLILPGVGAFDETMTNLVNSGLKEELNKVALIKKKPILGICVGMQILADGSDEGKCSGLGWIPGRVRKFNSQWFTTKPSLPHMGWNNVTAVKDNPLLVGMDSELGFYFVHSYYFECANADEILATTEYGIPFSSAVSKQNIFGVQFHPEKSHSNGIKLLENFARL